MNVPVWLWFATIAGILVLLAVDLFIVDHNPHAIKVSEAARWVTFYVALAIVFGLGILLFSGGQYAGEFFAGYITEYSLSVDNLFVFVIIMSTFGVPAIHQHKVLLFGILAALVLRGLFIAAGAAVIERFEWVFYIFGAFLLYTGYRLAFRKEQDEDEYKENPALRILRRVLPVTEDYHGSRVFTRVNGRRFVTPMLVVMLAIGTTDILFALDSIPAIFGLTKEPFLVFASNAFALMGLRQLYFLLGGLLNRLIYLDTGLAVILGFIGVKLILEALHGEGVSWAPEIGIVPSLAVIIAVLALTTWLSLRAVRRDPSAAKQLPSASTTAGGREVRDVGKDGKDGLEEKAEDADPTRDPANDGPAADEPDTDAAPTGTAANGTAAIGTAATETAAAANGTVANGTGARAPGRPAPDPAGATRADDRA